MKTLKIFGVLVALALVFGACKKDFTKEEITMKELGGKKNSTIVWNGAVDKLVAVNIMEVRSGRTNASGEKIPSNAHSAKYPGIYFIWDAKQKDNGYLKVAAYVFEECESFVLTSKEGNAYFDFPIAIQPNQQKTGDDCYVFFIPRALNNKNINMVFIGEFVEKEPDVNFLGNPPVISNPPIIDETECEKFYFLISEPGLLGIEVDPENVWHMPGDANHIKQLWSNSIRNNYPTQWDAMMNMVTESGVRPTWIWDRWDSWKHGFTGSQIIVYISEFNINGEIFEDVIPFYFACDNAAVVFVNGTRVHWTTESFGNRAIPESIHGLKGLGEDAFDGEPWQHLYEVDIRPYLKQG
ncbi:MAG: hypothetical protein LBP96_06040, partial [Bacteroidales bacterium]|nr:hypothetical protein [Bacteroidales bacterium]